MSELSWCQPSVEKVSQVPVTQLPARIRQMEMTGSEWLASLIPQRRSLILEKPRGLHESHRTGCFMSS